MRARTPDVVGSIERDGVQLGYEVHGDEHTGTVVLLMPTWTIIHSRFWKFQVPYLARHHRVVVYDGPGNGASDRVTVPARYTAASYAADAAAVMDACGVERAVAVGLSLGAWYSVELATLRPDSIAGLVLVGGSLPVGPALPQRMGIAERFLDPAPERPTGWDRYNLDYWHRHYRDFTEWFFTEAFPEPHSTKALEDTVGWAAETGPDVLQAEAFQPPPSRPVTDLLAELRCPTLLVHGDDDRITAHGVGVEAARLSGGTLVTFEGSGHIPNVRDPVRFNHLLHDFVQRVDGAAAGDALAQPSTLGTG
ncbi:MAG: alpha/beta fold hydrolase, partial [Acidimicrobiia bacterium]